MQIFYTIVSTILHTRIYTFKTRVECNRYLVRVTTMFSAYPNTEQNWAKLKRGQ